MSFGTDPFGAPPFGLGFIEGGGGETEPPPPDTLDLESAVALSNQYVELYFNHSIDFSSIDALEPAGYQISPVLEIVSVGHIGSTRIQLVTSPQTEGVVYTVTVLAPLISEEALVLGEDEATFTGVGLVSVSELTALTARTHCMGRRIDLSWQTPVDVTWVKILRRQKNWVYDETDPHDVVYEGPAINEFIDSGVLPPMMPLLEDVAEHATEIHLEDLGDEFSAGQLIRIEDLYGMDAHYEIHTIQDIEYTDTGVTITLMYPIQKPFLAGARVSLSSQLREQTFYYYTVAVSTDDTPDPVYTIGENSNVMGLSIKEMDSKNTFFWRNTPEYYREKDEGEGEGYLDKWYDIGGCWLNLMRGHTMAMKLLNDGDETPFNTLSAKNISLGIEPEGFSYDYEIPRRTLLQLSNVYKRRGTCEGLIRAVRMFTKWEAACAEFTLGGCSARAKSFGTWDGQSTTRHVVDSSAVANSERITHGSPLFDLHAYDGGTVVGPVGDIVCVSTNTLNELSIKRPPKTHMLTELVLAGATSIGLNNTVGLRPGMEIQLEQEEDPIAEIVEISEIDPSVPTVFLTEPLANTYAQGSRVSIGKSLIRWEVRGTDAEWSIDGDDVVSMFYPRGKWVENQWKNFYVRVGTTNYLITGNSTDRLIVAGLDVPVETTWRIAPLFVGGGLPVHAYKLYSGNHSFLYEPLFDLELRGTRWDPFNRLWMGLGSTILGAWGAADVGLYITTPVAQHIGYASDAAGATLMLDPNQPAPEPDAWVGKYLNPNQNQTKLFKIISNTDNQVVVDTGIDNLVVDGMSYVVLDERDANRYRALVNRFKAPMREFANMDIDVRIFFSPVLPELEVYEPPAEA